MPFTLSHAAAVLPAVRRDGRGRGSLVPSALVAGSFAPDATYYADSVLPGAMAFGSVTHAPYGVLTMDVLITAALVGCWMLLRDPLIALVPGADRRARVYELLRGQGRRGRPVAALVLWFWVSAVIGAATHIVWDAFTHLDRWGTRLLPVLTEFVAGFPLYYYAQYGGSALALLLIAWFLFTAVRGMPGSSAVPRSVARLTGRGRAGAWALLGMCAAAGAVHRCVRLYEATGWSVNPVNYTPPAMFGAGVGLAGGVVLLALWLRFRARRTTGSASTAGTATAGPATADTAGPAAPFGPAASSGTAGLSGPAASAASSGTAGPVSPAARTAAPNDGPPGERRRGGRARV